MCRVSSARVDLIPMLDARCDRVARRSAEDRPAVLAAKPAARAASAGAELGLRGGPEDEAQAPLAIVDSLGPATPNRFHAVCAGLLRRLGEPSIPACEDALSLRACGEALVLERSASAVSADE